MRNRNKTGIRKIVVTKKQIDNGRKPASFYCPIERSLSDMEDDFFISMSKWNFQTSKYWNRTCI